MVDAFFGTRPRMQASIAILCDSIHSNSNRTNHATKQEQGGKPKTGHTHASGDPVTQTILLMLSSPVHIQLTVVGWQPLRGRELTFPFHLMTSEQKQALKALIEGEPAKWMVYEHAMTYRRPATDQAITLDALDVLGALCSSILASTTYKDRRLRVAVCNILLQRVQASIPIDKHTQAALNARLFPLEWA